MTTKIHIGYDPDVESPAEKSSEVVPDCRERLCRSWSEALPGPFEVALARLSPFSGNRDQAQAVVGSQWSFEIGVFGPRQRPFHVRLP